MAFCPTESRSVVRGLAVVLLAASVTLFAPAAHAGEPSVQAQYDTGKQALKDGKPEAALTHFKQALAHSDGSAGITWQLLLAVALTYQDLDRLVAAHEYFKRFLTITEQHRKLMPRKWLKRRELVKGDLDQLEAQLDKTHALVMVRSTPAGAALTLDGEGAGADGDAKAPCPLYVAPGEHTLSASMPGYASASKTLPLRKGSMVTVDLLLEATDEPVVALKPLSAQPPPKPVATTIAVQATDEGPGAGPWWVIGSAGAAAVGGAVMTVLGELAAQDLDEKGDALAGGPAAGTDPGKAIDDYRQLESDMSTYRTMSYVLYGVAGAAAIGGVLWLVLAGGDDHQEPEDLVMPRLGVYPTQGGAAVHGTWSF